MTETLLSILLLHSCSVLKIRLNSGGFNFKSTIPILSLLIVRAVWSKFKALSLYMYNATKINARSKYYVCTCKRAFVVLPSIISSVVVIR